MESEAKERPYADVPFVPESDPLDVAMLTGEGKGEVELEIGFGKGRFILDRAAERPEIRFVGVETRRKWVALVSSRAEKRQLANVRVYCGDIRRLLPRLAPDACLSKVYVNFPDPWWKARHAKRMVVTPVVLKQIARLLAVSGELFVQTDVDFRARAYMEIISSTTGLVPHSGDGTIGENPFGARSPREAACERIGLPIYRMLFRRGERE